MMTNPTLYAGDTILTFSGHYLNVFDPDPEHICIEDIAHGLSHVPRFAGQTKKFISVAEHSYNVACRVPDAYQLEGLLHDASEAYLMDIPKPIKRHLPDYIKLEHNLMKAIAEKFGFPHPTSPVVKEADKAQLEYEHYNFRLNNKTALFSAEEAKGMFLLIYKRIRKEEYYG